MKNTFDLFFLTLFVLMLSACSLTPTKKYEVTENNQLSPVNLVVRYGDKSAITLGEKSAIDDLKKIFINSKQFHTINTSYNRKLVTIKATIIGHKAGGLSLLTGLPNKLFSLFTLGIIPEYTNGTWIVKYEIFDKTKLVSEVTYHTEFSEFKSLTVSWRDITRNTLKRNFDTFIENIRKNKT